MKIFNKIVLISAIALFLVSSINAQYVANISKRGTSVTPFLKVAQGARATGMGSAFVGIADDASSIFWNVAGIARLGKNTVMFDHTQWIADLQYNYLAGSLDLGNYGALGVSLVASNYGEMNVTTISEPDGTGQVFSVKDYAFSLAWAINLTEDFAIGFNPKIIYESIWQTSGYALGIDMGILYNTPFKGFTLGMSITNFSSKMRLQGTSDIVLYDPDPTTTGNNGRIPADLYTDSWSLPLVFTMGLSYKVLDSDMHKLIIDVDAHHPSDNYESVSAGGEYVFKDFLSLRGGYKTLFLKDAEESFALGAGIKQQILGNIAFHVDYAYQNFGRLSSVHKISVGVDF
jgi:opacity protein-like surface antigen